MEHEDIFKGLGVEIKLNSEEDFLKIKETLTRIGISSRKEKKLYQSCHILHKRGRYAIMHFKELFEMDGLDSNTSDNDIARRNTIVDLLEEWELLEVIEEGFEDEQMANIGQIKILSYKDKGDWELIPKYHIGNS
tara:strand:- start:2926 stop:3330 length:405 start_codon:yes stop_codon:yes gene_type:complete